ncbi:hypothetical protein D3C72_2579610 [compost metagenome]
MVAGAFEQYVVEALDGVDDLLQLAFLQGLAVFFQGLFQGLDVLGLGPQGEQLDDQALEYAT